MIDGRKSSGLTFKVIKFLEASDGFEIMHPPASLPLKSYRAPIGKACLPTTLFQGRAVKLRGCKCKLPGSHNGKMFFDSAGKTLECGLYELVKVQKCTLQGKVYSHREGG